ncbi:hypothetical protein RHSP_08248 [Rhizobium freirei PRF 81]|uniref:DUF4168 domain-containing protein n=4 Tax=Rhizobium TaxID=379 RepID=A0A6P1CET0_RHITR|nr:hypothetical protein RTCIAT899_PB00565 [Rhizobium tropici CIAT 899]AYG70346.1 DUF4168 domain-containing protein [Rhizobium sp. CCGE531]AYG76746.1 DUF4168 domain-containing protein [Rhizobium sp. CCGE532]ENN86704.1 hypothetical protein RHSP_08248 [Rhizobium freirei PRF 81]MBB4245549.1 hypothetical protein [Rhizobium tropici]MBB6489575.1 hypothetical protein [Rhizobium lusitanum]TGE87598.1 DUF4168 domain-containing protein [Rhizobium sp. SEMIA 4088]
MASIEGHIVAESSSTEAGYITAFGFTLGKKPCPPHYMRGIKMIDRYISAASLTAAVLGLMFLSNPAAAQETQPAQGQPDGNGAAAAISDQKIEAFAVAYLQVDKIRQEYAAKIKAAPDETAKQELRSEARKQMIQAVQTSPNISVDEYNEILAAAQKDPVLVKKLDDKLQKSAPAKQ